ncbi:sodium-dependent bicarbonate transport family permease [Paenibacillus sp. PL2-23]|uniref:sodium-dependent bicarbonate transport family permease n=1 Tax=Paenibacillus sp. PL2-23 TaxID=2100729 RepID=UPI0030FC1E8F
MKEIIMQNMLSPVVLFFALGLLAALVKSDLKIPPAIGEILSVYLLIAIGLKGGIELSHYSPLLLVKPMLGVLFLGTIIPIAALVVLRWLKLDFPNAIGLAAAYGSVSIVTYGAALSFLDHSGVAYESYMNVLIVLMESPAIILALFLMKWREKSRAVAMATPAGAIGITAGSSGLLNGLFDKEVLRESVFGKSVLLLLGSLLIGWASGEAAVPIVKPLFIDMYKGVLMIFLLQMGIIAGQRLPEVRKHGMKLILFGLLMPLFCGVLGVLVGHQVGLSLGGSALMGVMAGSASYIAAPAALKTSVPEANPSIYLGLSLGITFPMNLLIGIPFYYTVASWVQ